MVLGTVGTVSKGQGGQVRENLNLPHTIFSLKETRWDRMGKCRVMAQVSLLPPVSCMTLGRLIFLSLGFLINCNYEDLKETYTTYFAYCLF